MVLKRFFMTKSIVFAGGCFWGVEKFFSLIDGVTHTEVAYVNGNTSHPSYKEVCTLNTGHTEAIKVEYDSTKITLLELLEFYYKVVDPTSLNKQGNDVGQQYRTGIYSNDPEDIILAKESLTQLQKSYKNPIVIEVTTLENYTKAEDYHQNYLNKNPNGYCHLTQEHFQLASKKKSSDI